MEGLHVTYGSRQGLLRGKECRAKVKLRVLLIWHHAKSTPWKEKEKSRLRDEQYISIYLSNYIKLVVKSTRNSHPPTHTRT